MRWQVAGLTRPDNTGKILAQPNKQLLPHAEEGSSYLFK